MASATLIDSRSQGIWGFIPAPHDHLHLFPATTVPSSQSRSLRWTLCPRCMSMRRTLRWSSSAFINHHPLLLILRHRLRQLKWATRGGSHLARSATKTKRTPLPIFSHRKNMERHVRSSNMTTQDHE